MVKILRARFKAPVFLMGDFNVSPTSQPNHEIVFDILVVSILCHGVNAPKRFCAGWRQRRGFTPLDSLEFWS